MLKGYARIQGVVCQWPSPRAKFKLSTVAHQKEFFYFVCSKDCFISGDLHNECQDEQDGIFGY